MIAFTKMGDSEVNRAVAEFAEKSGLSFDESVNYLLSLGLKYSSKDMIDKLSFAGSVLMEMTSCGSVSSRDVLRRCRAIRADGLDALAQRLGLVIEMRENEGRGRPKKFYARAAGNFDGEANHETK